MDLTPPPRPPRNPPSGPGTEASRKSPLPLLVTLIGFSLLLAGGVWAFVFLPRWVEDRPRVAALPESSGTEDPTGTANLPATPESSGDGMLEAAPLPPEDPTTARGLQPLEPTPPVTREIAQAPAAQAPIAARTRPAQAAKSPPTPKAPEIDADFAGHMSAGLAALGGEEFADAKAAFERARALDPSSPSVADGLARAAAGLKLQTIASDLQAAATAEQTEAWAEAAARYQAVLKLEPGLDEALRGQQRASTRAVLDGRLAGYLGHSHRLSSQEVLNEAAVTLETALEIEPAGPKLTDQRQRLAKLIDQYSIAIPVTLQSDGETQVVVYRVGNLGAFSQRQIELRPGKYTVVGTRDGYRDVRHTLAVEPGSPAASLRVACEERI